MDEVGDVAPQIVIAFAQADGGAEAFALGLQPDVVDALERQLALAAFVVQPGFELVEGDLAHHGVEHVLHLGADQQAAAGGVAFAPRSEEHTSELQSLMRTSYAVFCLKNKTTKNKKKNTRR